MHIKGVYGAFRSGSRFAPTKSSRVLEKDNVSTVKFPSKEDTNIYGNISNKYVKEVPIMPTVVLDEEEI